MFPDSLELSELGNLTRCGSTHHFGAWDVLLWVGQVDVEGVRAPCDALK